MTPDIVDILARLVAFPTLSRQSNLELLEYVESLLRPAGIRCERFFSTDATQANLWASVGPEGSGGVVLSGHCDVVPVAGQAWSRDPFALHLEEGRYYGRGTADMKGFLAVAIHAMLRATERPLIQPLHLAISYDEEIGCLGVRGMLGALAARPARPALCIVGEPTGMRIAHGHKGKRALRACCHGQEGHSALAPQALNALHLGAAFVTRLQARQDALEANGARDAAYEIPYSTLHVGVMQGGTALNIVPNRCDLDFELRNVPGDDPDAIIADIRQDAEAIAAPHRNRFPNARIEIEEVSGYPGLDTAADIPAIAWLRALLGRDDPLTKVSFGTEGGLFQQSLGLPTLVCGPGHMAQGHKPDEYVSVEQLHDCADFLAALTDALVIGQAPA
ncbi:acetylornithine deacetylase [Roseinatronobacter sp. S2]|uniref:acetylornithine deacetylase n=1 Tax=Roseinatronobacter sp. S2 TaxID=3035471 RepID=UPI00240F52F4|nr:acetylornithine deacetylase [Roseinatronobacter sp. S2]WFE76647.1 acetylornithine deacetylase [Roseinatronobacter sp. S2]